MALGPGSSPGRSACLRWILNDRFVREIPKSCETATVAFFGMRSSNTSHSSSPYVPDLDPGSRAKHCQSSLVALGPGSSPGALFVLV